MTNRTSQLSPNLDALKKEAKLVLKSVKASNPAALERVSPYFDPSVPLKLTQIQLVLAREHGFKSWAVLRSQAADQDALMNAQGEVSRIQLRMNGRKSLPQLSITQLDTAHFARQLATMFKVGIPLIEAIEIIADDTVNPRMKEVILDIRSKISTGKQLNYAMRLHPNYFSDLFCTFVKKGETKGTLDKTLEYIADYQENLHKQQQFGKDKPD
jgi:Type II secretion system (T2SS), protein F